MSNDFLTQAVAYARQRWWWDDPTHIVELFDSHAPLDQTPQQWIDYLACKYELFDPKEW